MPDVFDKRKIPADMQKYFVRAELGLEPTPDKYVENMVEVFRLVRELLADDGTLWLNLGDSYAASPKGNLNGQDKSGLTSTKTQETSPTGANKLVIGLKPKDLVGIPWRVAFALRADGWWLRQDIIWSKPNPMPESVRDRCTKAHEYLFLLSKSERYFYDADAIAEDCVTGDPHRPYGSPGANALDPRGRQGEGRVRTTGKHSSMPKNSSGRRMVENVARAREAGADHDNPFGSTRNKRSVWTVTTQPFKEMHFATFPPALIEPCILAGSRPGDVVLDPFMGSGTTAEVCMELGRKCIGIELNPDYLMLRAERIENAQRQGRLIA